MEATKVPEEPHTIMGANEHPSSKDPSTEDLQPLSTSELPSVPSIPQTTSEEPQASEVLLTPSSQTRFRNFVSESSLEPSVFETPSDPPMSEFPSVSQVFSEPYGHEFPLVQTSSKTLDSISELSAEVHTDLASMRTDIASTQKEEASPNEQSVDTSDIISYSSLPELQLDNTSLPVIPTNQEELMDMVKTSEQFGAPLNHLFQWEKSEALNSIQTGIYVGWRCPHYLWDCFRICEESKCFCGHLLKEHQITTDMIVPCSESQCRCLMFCFIPSRPEEVGEFWLKRRATFDPKAWRAQCRCKHSHEEHAATGAHPCKSRGCGCKSFESNFLCAACDRRWEEHETFFEIQGMKRRKKKARGSHCSNSWHRAF
ncbi:protein FAM221B [Dipodomys spectabilis]|uniref:protein FAM221B n=1 Tax=Dipodomys spectabilis TaxID=105255 RepID=UPI001C5388FA|nr:protein FAM221B [Dipodomys spectabilis]